MADDSSVKMETLKKAYAEIILNTSKEAAAKIMVADRRARCFEKDLNAVKEDALRMLVQLKQMLDFKAAEAEVKSENQQRKIDELEAQLSEAEGIIVDLREELRLTQDKLEEVKYSQWRPVKQQNSEDFEDQQPDDRLTAKTDDGRCVTNKYPSTEDTCGTKNLVNMALPTKPLQPSILSRAVHYPSRDQLLRSIVEKPSTSFRPSMLSRAYVKTSRDHCSSSSSEPDELDAKLVSNGSEAKSQEFETDHGQSFRDGSRRNRKNLKYQEAIAALRRSSHGKSAKSLQLPSLTRCRTKVVKQNKSSIELSDKNGMYKMDDNHDTVQTNSTKFGDISKSREMEGNTAEKESDMSCDPTRLDTSLQDVNLHNIQISDDEETAGISSKADSDKVLRFTFQRKRKRELLTNLDSSKTPEEKNVALLEKEDAAKLQKSVVKDEQTKDGRQLLQIAQQLISLSGNGHS